MNNTDALFIAKLDLLQHNLADIKFRNSTHIGSILQDVELLIESIGNFTDALRAFNELESKYNSHRTETCRFRLSNAKHKLLHKCGEGLANMRRPLVGYAYETGNKKPKPIYSEPIKPSESIAIYEKLLTLLKDA